LREGVLNRRWPLGFRIANGGYEKGAGITPVALCGRFRDAQHFPCVGNAEPYKETEINDLGLYWVVGLKFLKCIVER